jgi:CBS domain-containing protein/Flp pilus assembly pilin Flp
MNRSTRRVRRRGSAAIEYALFLALVAGGIVLAADTVSYAMRSSYDKTSIALSKEHIELRHLPVEDMEADIDMFASVLAPDGDGYVQAYQYAAVAASLMCAGLVWYGLYCRRRKVLVEDHAHELTEQINELPPEMSNGVLFSKRQQILRILATDMAALLESRLEVRHLMSRRLLTVPPSATREEIQTQMDENKLRHLLVCDEAGRLIGLVSDRDLVSRSGKTAKQLMTTDLITVEAHALVNPSITLLVNKKISCLPVVAEGVPIGVITSTDLMMALQCTMQLLQKVAGEVSHGHRVERAATTISSLASTN